MDAITKLNTDHGLKKLGAQRFCSPFTLFFHFFQLLFSQATMLQRTFLLSLPTLIVFLLSKSSET